MRLLVATVLMVIQIGVVYTSVPHQQQKKTDTVCGISFEQADTEDNTSATSEENSNWILQRRGAFTDLVYNEKTGSENTPFYWSVPLSEGVNNPALLIGYLKHSYLTKSSQTNPEPVIIPS